MEKIENEIYFQFAYHKFFIFLFYFSPVSFLRAESFDETVSTFGSMKHKFIWYRDQEHHVCIIR